MVGGEGIAPRPTACKLELSCIHAFHRLSLRFKNINQHRKSAIVYCILAFIVIHLFSIIGVDPALTETGDRRHGTKTEDHETRRRPSYPRGAAVRRLGYRASGLRPQGRALGNQVLHHPLSSRGWRSERSAAVHDHRQVGCVDARRGPSQGARDLGRCRGR